MGVRPGYKVTELGVIPDDWKVMSLQALAVIERGKFTARPRNDPKYYGGNVPFIQTGDVTNSGGCIRTYNQTLNPSGLKVSKLFRRGTLFFTIAANIGDVAFTAFDTACPDSLAAITPKKGIDARWLAYELRRRKAAFEQLATQNAQLNINLEKLRPYLLPVPTPAEQTGMGKMLGDMDALIESLEQLIAKKRHIKQGAIQELLTGKKRLPKFEINPGYKQTAVGLIPQDWGVRELQDIADFTNGKPYEGEVRSDGRFWLITLDSIGIDGSLKQEHKKTDLNDSSLKWNDIVVVLSDLAHGNLLGLCDVIPADNKYVLNQRMGRLRLKVPADTQFVRLQINRRQEYFRNRGQGTSQKHVYRRDFDLLQIPFPPPAEQVAIGTILSDIAAEISALEAKLGKAHQIKQGMMQELLTGRTRLV